MSRGRKRRPTRQVTQLDQSSVPDVSVAAAETPPSPHVSRANRFLVITTIVSIVIATVSAVGTLYSVHVSHQIALESGSLDKAIPHVLLQSFQLVPNVPTQVTFGAPFGQNTAVMATLPIIIHNSGAKTMKGLGLTVRLPSRISIEEGLLHHQYNEFVPLTGSATHKHAVYEQFGFDIYTLPDLNPGQTFAIRQPFALFETRRNRPEQELTPHVITLFSFDALVSVTAQDLRTEDYPLVLFGVKSESKEQLKKDFQATINREGRNVRASMSMPRYLWHLLFDRGEFREFMIFPDYKVMTVPPDGRVYADQGTGTVTEMLYRPISVSLLFRGRNSS